MTVMTSSHTQTKTYKITRFFERFNNPTVLLRGLTREEAQDHCRSPESSSRTATSAEALERTRLYGPWFDGYERE